MPNFQTQIGWEHTDSKFENPLKENFSKKAIWYWPLKFEVLLVNIFCLAF